MEYKGGKTGKLEAIGFDEGLAFSDSNFAVRWPSPQTGYITHPGSAFCSAD